MSENNNKKVQIIEFTDPACTWCWGSEPILRKLESYYKEQVDIGFVMGGLVRDVREFRDNSNDIGGEDNIERTNQNVAKHWLEASVRHGMPVETNGFHLFTEENPSTWPMNVAYKSAQFENLQLANKFLRRMREAVAAEALPANRMEILIELAQEVGLNVGQFIQHINDGTATQEFFSDLKKTQELKAQGFPSYLVQYEDKGVMLRGYTSFENFKSVIDYLSNNEVHGQLASATDENILAFVEKYDRVAPIEIQESFDLSDEQIDIKITELTSKNFITVTPKGNGSFISKKSQPLSCDTGTGTCSV